MLDLLTLKWWATAAAVLSRPYISSNSVNFLKCHGFSLLLGSTSSITRGSSYRSRGVIQGSRYCIEHEGNDTRTVRDHFTAIQNFLERWTAHLEMISITQHLKWILKTLELTAIATGGGHKILTAVQYVLQLILHSYDLMLHLYFCLHFSWLWITPCAVCVSVHKFWKIKIL